MSQPRYNPEHKTELDAFLLEIPGIKPGQMFGHPGYFVGGKMFACLVPEGVALKLPFDTVIDLLADARTQPFAPGGSPMRQWVQINLDAARDYEQYLSYFEQSISYVLEQAAGHSSTPD